MRLHEIVNHFDIEYESFAGVSNGQYLLLIFTASPIGVLLQKRHKISYNLPIGNVNAVHISRLLQNTNYIGVSRMEKQVDDSLANFVVSHVLLLVDWVGKFYCELHHARELVPNAQVAVDATRNDVVVS